MSLFLFFVLISKLFMFFICHFSSDSLHVPDHLWPVQVRLIMWPCCEKWVQLFVILNLTTLHQRTVTQGKKRLNVRNWSNFCLHFHPPLLPFDLQPDHMSHQLLGDHEETHPALLLWVSSLKPNKKINRLIFSADACLTLFLLSECKSVESSETVQQNVWV